MLHLLDAAQRSAEPRQLGSSHALTSSSQPGRAQGGRSAGASSARGRRDRREQLTLALVAQAQSFELDPADPAAVGRRPPAGIAQRQLEHGLDAVRPSSSFSWIWRSSQGVVPSRRSKAGTTRGGVRDPEVADDDARQPPRAVAAEEEDARLVGMAQRRERLRTPAHVLGGCGRAPRRAARRGARPRRRPRGRCARRRRPAAPARRRSGSARSGCPRCRARGRRSSPTPSGRPYGRSPRWTWRARAAAASSSRASGRCRARSRCRSARPRAGCRTPSRRPRVGGAAVPGPAAAPARGGPRAARAASPTPRSTSRSSCRGTGRGARTPTPGCRGRSSR